MSTQSGHPDWLGYAQWSGPPLASVAAQAIPLAATRLGPYNTPHYRSVLILVENLTVNAEFAAISTFPGAAGIEFALTVQRVWAGYNLALNVPTGGAQFSLSLQSLQVGAGTAKVSIIPNNFDPGYRSVLQYRQLMTALNVSLGPGATLSATMPPYAGRCHFNFYSSVAAANLAIVEEAASGGDLAVYYSQATTGAFVQLNGDLSLGTGLNSVRITNNAGSASSVTAAIYGDYSQQGDF